MLSIVRRGVPAAAIVLAVVSTTPVSAQRRQIDLEDWKREQGWKTDWANYIVHPESLTLIGDRDRIPPLDAPTFESIASARDWLGDREPVAVVKLHGEVRAYPVQIMMHHDVANDVIGDTPFVVSFCILCGSALAYDRRMGDDTLEFSYAGALNNSNLVMYDRNTHSLWGQIVGQSLVGAYAGQRLRFIPAPVMSFREFRDNEPDGVVLSRNTGFDRAYGDGRMTDYDTSPNPIRRLFRRATDQRLPAKERVMVVEQGDDIVAVPYSVLGERRVMATEVGGEPFIIFWGPGTASIYSERTADGHDVGAAVAFRPHLDGRRLRFRSTDEPGRFEDRETGSTWTLAGKAVSGPLAGRELEPAVHGVHFWFVWAAYRPETRVVR